MSCCALPRRRGPFQYVSGDLPGGQSRQDLVQRPGQPGQEPPRVAQVMADRAHRQAPLGLQISLIGGQQDIQRGDRGRRCRRRRRPDFAQIPQNRRERPCARPGPVPGSPPLRQELPGHFPGQVRCGQPPARQPAAQICQPVHMISDRIQRVTLAGQIPAQATSELFQRSGNHDPVTRNH